MCIRLTGETAAGSVDINKRSVDERRRGGLPGATSWNKSPRCSTVPSTTIATTTLCLLSFRVALRTLCVTNSAETEESSEIFACLWNACDQCVGALAPRSPLSPVPSADPLYKRVLDRDYVLSVSMSFRYYLAKHERYFVQNTRN